MRGGESSCAFALFALDTRHIWPYDQVLHRTVVLPALPVSRDLSTQIGKTGDCDGYNTGEKHHTSSNRLERTAQGKDFDDVRT